jgi:hypothetical protein
MARVVLVKLDVAGGVTIAPPVSLQALTSLLTIC